MPPLQIDKIRAEFIVMLRVGCFPEELPVLKIPSLPIARTSRLPGFRSMFGGTALLMLSAIGYAAPAAALPSVSIDDVSIVEGNSGTVAARFTFTLSAASTDTVSVRFNTVDGTATSGEDYTGGGGLKTFAPGETKKSQVVNINGDTLFEADETYFIDLSSPVGVTIGKGRGVGTIVNDDVAPDTTPDPFSFTPATGVAVGSVQTSNTITVSGINTASPISIVGGSYSINGGSFVSASGTVTVGQTVQLRQTASGNPGTTTSAVLTIGGVSSSYDVTTALAGLSIADASVVEGNSGTRNLSFVVSLSPAATSPVTVAYATANGTATAGSDYVATSGTLNFPAGSTSQTITVTVIGDTEFEPDETLLVNLSNPVNATLGQAQATGTISNDDAATPTLSVADASVVEGNTGTVNMPFVVTLSPAATTTVTVRATTSNGTATSGSDYNGGTLTVTFAPGETSKTVNVGVRGDTVVEPDETFFATLSSATGGALLGRSQATGTIVNDDGVPPPADTTPDPFSFTPVTGVAVGSVQTSNTITVGGINAASPISVAGGSYSINGGGFVTASGTVTVGQTVQLRQTASGSPATTTSAVLSIGGVSSSFDVTTAQAGLSIADASVVEGNSGTRNLSFVVSLSPAATTPVTVAYATANGTATAGSDYVATSGTLSFPAGTTSQTINVVVTGDTEVEPDETVLVNLSGATGASVARTQGIGTIVNDDAATPTLNVADASVLEGNTGTVNMPFTVTLSPAATTTVTVRATTSNGTATSGSDYNGGTLTVSFAPGETSKLVNVGVRGDTLVEPDETFFATLSSPTGGAVIGRAQATGTILNDDGQAAVDTTPDPFSFAPRSDVETGSTQTSDPATISGINAPAPISVAGGLYSINGGTFTGAAGQVTVGSTVQVQLLASYTASTSASATLTVGGYSTAFTVTTKGLASDTTPDPFSFAPVTDAEPGSVVSSAPVTISGIDADAPISVSGGLYNINGGPFTSTASVVRVGDRVAAQVTASSNFNEAQVAAVTIGGVVGQFSVTTKTFVIDDSPNPFRFPARYAVDRGSLQRSAAVQIRGINAAVPISITGGRYSINGAAYTTALGSVKPDDIVEVDVAAAATFGSTTSARLTVGTFSTDFAVETLVEDTRPVPFVFGSVVGAAPLSTVTSNEIVVTGINTPTPITVSQGRYRINDGPFTTASGLVSNGSRVSLSGVAAQAAGAQIVTTLTVGSVSADFTIVTAASGDSVPDAFAFPTIDGFPLLAIYSNPVIITGIDVPVRVSIVGGTYSLNDRPFTSVPGVARNGDVLRVLVTPGPMLRDVAVGTVTVGDYSTTFSVTTAAPDDTIPDSIQFEDSRSTPINSVLISEPVIIKGVNVPVPVSVTDGYTYSINDGPFIAGTSMVRWGDVIRVKVVTGATYNLNYPVSLTVSNLTVAWSVRTIASPTRPERFTLATASIYAAGLVLPGSVQTMQPVAIINPSGTVPITVTGGTYSINGAPYTAAAGTVVAGDQVTVRMVMPDSFDTTASVSLKVANVSSSISLTTTIDPASVTPETLSGASDVVIYRDDPTVPLRLFVFKPPGWKASDRRSGYIDFSGGGWARGGLPSTRPRRWATDYGMIGISPDTRVNDRFGTYAYVAADDARLVLRWVQEHAAELGVDPARVVVTGSSSGGGNAVWASLLEPPVTTASTSSPPFRAGAVVLKSGVSSTTPDARIARAQRVRFGEFADSISPDRDIDPATPPYLIMHADGDLVFAETANLKLCSLIRTLGRVCEFKNKPGVGHTWPDDPVLAEAAVPEQVDFFYQTGMLPAVQVAP